MTTDTLTTILAATGRSHYTVGEEMSCGLQLTSNRPGYTSSPMIWNDNVLYWTEGRYAGNLRSAQVREDGRIELREYQTPRRYVVAAHDRLLYGAACGGDDSGWESCTRYHGGWPVWPGLRFSEHLEAPERACRVEWTGEDHPRRIAGLVIGAEVTAIEQGRLVWSRPHVSLATTDRYAHPYRGRIL